MEESQRKSVTGGAIQLHAAAGSGTSVAPPGLTTVLSVSAAHACIFTLDPLRVTLTGKTFCPPKRPCLDIACAHPSAHPIPGLPACDVLSPAPAAVCLPRQ